MSTINWADWARSSTAIGIPPTNTDATRSGIFEAYLSNGIRTFWRSKASDTTSAPHTIEDASRTCARSGDPYKPNNALSLIAAGPDETVSAPHKPKFQLTIVSGVPVTEEFRAPRDYEAFVFDIKPEDSFDFLSDEYADLFANSDATPFQHPLWLDRLYTSLAPQLGSNPLVISVRSQANGRLRMVLPLLRHRRALMSVVEFADLGVSDYAAPVCDHATLKHILDDQAACAKIQSALKSYDLLRMQKLRGNTTQMERLLRVRSVSSMNMSAHVVTLQKSYSEWRTQSISPSYRKELDKKRRQLHRKGTVLFECSSNPDTIRSTFESMRQYRLPRFQHAADGDLLQQPLYLDFYVDIATAGSATGLARTYTLSMDGRTIAGVMGLAHRGQFLVLLGGFDHASFKNQSIGALMFEEVARDCIERGDTILDFTIGDEPYKQLFGARPVPMLMFTKVGSRLGSLASFVVEQVPGAKKVVKRLIERKPMATAPRANDNVPAEAVSARLT